MQAFDFLSKQPTLTFLSTAQASKQEASSPTYLLTSPWKKINIHLTQIKTHKKFKHCRILIPINIFSWEIIRRVISQKLEADKFYF